MNNKERSILVAFSEMPARESNKVYDMTLASDALDEFIDPGSIYEASAFLEELSLLTRADGSSLVKSFIYKGYELWWIYYNSLYLYFCLPYTQYQRLLAYLKNFKIVYLYKPPYKTLFYYYLKAHGVTVVLIQSQVKKRSPFFSFGIFMQIILTAISLPLLVIKRPKYMLFTGDKLETGKDYDFRFKFLYKELRSRNLPFFECIRSHESWRVVLKHALLIRRRPVIYSEAIVQIGKFLNHKFLDQRFDDSDATKRFKFLIATHYLKDVYRDIYAIRIMKWILRMIGVRSAYITAALDRNIHAFLGAKLNDIPTVGILHGVSSREYNVYDFLPKFKGKKMLSVDVYGLWSEWWKEYYMKYSKAYLPEQLYVSGPMRPFEEMAEKGLTTHQSDRRPIRVLFVSEQLAMPKEVMPYLKTLLGDKNYSVYITFRPYRDEFEHWLRKNNPEILGQIGEENIIRTGIADAITFCDVVVGTMSTAVIEALFQNKSPLLFYTKKWGDYFKLADYGMDGQFFAKNPKDLMEKLRKIGSTTDREREDLRERYFGDPSKNGSAWVVDQLEKAVLKGHFTR